MRSHAVAVALALALAVVVLALLVVGAVTGLVIRHIVQVIPGVVLLLVTRKRSWFAYGALPISLIWFLLMFFAWLWMLFGIRIITGTFTPIEIVLTVVIGVGALAGIVFTIVERPRTAPLAGVAAFAVLAAAQVAALWLSFQPMIAKR